MSFEPSIAAAEVHALWRSGRQVQPYSVRYPGLTLENAYDVAWRIRGLRAVGGERVIGRKLAFTNRTLWSRYNIAAPGWGYVYDTTCHELTDFTDAAFSLAGFQEPRIEPEIMIGFDAAPEPGMSDSQLLACVGWIAHGYELVHSIFPDWRFAGVDPVMGFGLHAALFLGPRQPIGRFGWAEALANLEVTLTCNGTHVATGRGSDVLGSPLSALRNFNDGLGGDETRPKLMAGEFVSTGTITDAFPVQPGETWTTSLTGIPLPGARLRFS